MAVHLIWIFGFQALWSPYFLAALLLVLFVYFILMIPFRSRFQYGEPLSNQQGILFVISVFLLYAIKGSPLDLMAHLLFSVHMIQMAVLVLVIPPLFIASIPLWVWRFLLKQKGFRLFFTIFTKPLIALLVFNGLFSFYHVPYIFDHVMQNGWLHAGYSTVLFISATFMWWPLVNKLPETRNLNGIKKVGYIFADGILLTPACALIIFANTPLYATYADPKTWGVMMSLCVGTSTFTNLKLSGPEMFSSMNLIYDQQLGGVLMKIIQEIIYGIVLARVFFEWYKKDQEESESDMKQHLN